MKKFTKILIFVIISVSFSVVMQSCEKKSDSSTLNPPLIAVTTSEIAEITPESAVSGGFVRMNGEYECLCFFNK